MTGIFRLLARAVPAILLGMGLAPQAAYACTDGTSVRTYFRTQPPSLTPYVMFVRVRIVSDTGKLGDRERSVEARLEGRFARLSADGMIHIELPVAPLGDNCVEWGTLEGPVYVVVRAANLQGRRPSIVAEPMESPGLSERAELRALRRLRQKARIYIDPSFLAAYKL